MNTDKDNNVMRRNENKDVCTMVKLDFCKYRDAIKEITEWLEAHKSYRDTSDINFGIAKMKFDYDKAMGAVYKSMNEARQKAYESLSYVINMLEYLPASDRDGIKLCKHAVGEIECWLVPLHAQECEDGEKRIKCIAIPVNANIRLVEYFCLATKDIFETKEEVSDKQ